MLDTTLDAQTPDQRYAMDNKLFVQFRMQAVKQGAASDEAGRPIFKDTPYVRIHVPGDKTSIIDTAVEEEHKHRFTAQWEKFQKGMSQAPDGTPVEQWPQLTLSQAMEFKALGIFTVEQVSTMSDAAAQRFMGGQELKRRAETFLKLSKDTAEAQRLATENEELKVSIASLTDTVKRLAAQVEILSQNAQAPSAATPPGGKQHGRPSAGTAGG